MHSESYREKDFPIHVEMGDEGPVLDLGERMTSLNLPDSGCVLVDFVKNEDGTLQVKTVCLPAESDAEYEEEPRDLNEAFDRTKMDAEEADDDEEMEDET